MLKRALSVDEKYHIIMEVFLKKLVNETCRDYGITDSDQHQWQKKVEEKARTALEIQTRNKRTNGVTLAKEIDTLRHSISRIASEILHLKHMYEGKLEVNLQN